MKSLYFRMRGLAVAVLLFAPLLARAQPLVLRQLFAAGEAVNYTVGFPIDLLVGNTGRTNSPEYFAVGTTNSPTNLYNPSTYSFGRNSYPGTTNNITGALSGSDGITGPFNPGSRF